MSVRSSNATTELPTSGRNSPRQRSRITARVVNWLWQAGTSMGTTCLIGERLNRRAREFPVDKLPGLPLAVVVGAVI